MISECPGAKFFKQAEPENINCPTCSEELEIWTDEVKVICPHCKTVVARRQVQSCLDWCKFGKECVGEELYKKYLKNKRINSGGSNDSK